MFRFISSVIRWPFRIAAALVLVALIWRFVWEPLRLRSSISQALGLSTASTLNFSLERKEVLELATISQPLVIQYSASRGRWPVQSSLTLQGVFEAKVGFDLTENSYISVDRQSLHANVVLPAPKILSVEQKDFKVLQSQQAIWTSYTPQEQAEALNGMNEYARSIADNTAVLNAAIESLSQRLQAIARSQGATLTLAAGTNLAPVESK